MLCTEDMFQYCLVYLTNYWDNSFKQGEEDIHLRRKVKPYASIRLLGFTRTTRLLGILQFLGQSHGGAKCCFMFPQV